MRLEKGGLQRYWFDTGSENDMYLTEVLVQIQNRGHYLQAWISKSEYLNSE
jgi:hypothetical protein